MIEYKFDEATDVPATEPVPAEEVKEPAEGEEVPAAEEKTE